jgi:hypothetical protein
MPESSAKGSDLKLTNITHRHTRRDAGIQCQGWQFLRLMVFTSL